MVAYVNVDYKYTRHILWYGSKHEEIRLPHETVFVLIFYFIGAILSKRNVKVRDTKRLKKRDLPQKGVFLKKGR